MNGIRLVVLTVAALGFLQIDLSEVTAQRGAGMADYYRNNGRGKTNNDNKQQDRGGPSEFDQGPTPSGGPAGRGGGSARGGPSLDAPAGGSRGSTRSSRSSRSSRGSRSRGNNAIKSNPLFALFDQNGDGELSLEEIDAASRLLLELDANRDDAITSDEVEDMVAGGGDAEKDEEEEDDRSSRSARSSRGSDRGSSRTSRGSSRSTRGTASNSRSSRGAPAGGGMNSKFAGGAGMAGGLPGGQAGTPADAKDFAANDKNNDGVLTRSEMPRSLRTKFTKMDANGDKEIDENEFYDYVDNN